jgi:hypothetical protein
LEPARALDNFAFWQLVALAIRQVDYIAADQMTKHLCVTRLPVDANTLSGTRTPKYPVMARVIHGAKELKIEERPESLRPLHGKVLVRFGVGGSCGSNLLP